MKTPVFLVMLGLAIISNVSASIITISLSGSVTSVTDAQNHLDGTITVGESYTGTVRYNDAATVSGSGIADSTPFADYSITDVGTIISFTVGSTVFSADVVAGNGGIVQMNGDGTMYISKTINGITNPTVGLSHENYTLYGFHTPAASTELASAQLDSNPADWAVQLFQGIYPGNYFQVNLGVDSISVAAGDVTPIPEPASAFLAGAGLIASFFLSARQRRTEWRRLRSFC